MILRHVLLTALRNEPSVAAAAKAAKCSRRHIYRLAGRDGDVRAALRALQARGGQGRSQLAADLALKPEAQAELLDRLRAQLAHPNVWKVIEAAKRILALARAHRLTEPAEVGPVARS